MSQQPTTGSTQPAAPDAHYHMPPVNPGQTTGIIGLIFAFVGLAPIGLILSIISTVKSSEGQSPRTLGIVGIVFNIVGIVTFLFFIAVVLVSYQGVQSRALDSAALAKATVVRKVAETYFVQHGSYPASTAELAASLQDSSVQVTTSPTSTTAAIGYRPCGPSGARVDYLKYSSTVPVVLYLGTGSATTC